MAKIMFLFSLLLMFFLSHCCSVKESTQSITTQRDTTIQIESIHDSVFVYDESLGLWYNDAVEIYRKEIDSLKSLLDTTGLLIFDDPKPVKPFRHTWRVSKVTQKGDSIFIIFKIENANGTFIFREIPAPIKIKVTDTHTIKTQEKELAWYESLWRDFKDVVLFGLVFILSIILIYLKFIKR